MKRVLERKFQIHPLPISSFGAHSKNLLEKQALLFQINLFTVLTDARCAPKQNPYFCNSSYFLGIFLRTGTMKNNSNKSQENKSLLNSLRPERNSNRITGEMISANKIHCFGNWYSHVWVMCECVFVISRRIHKYNAFFLSHKYTSTKRQQHFFHSSF